MNGRLKFRRKHPTLSLYGGNNKQDNLYSATIFIKIDKR